MPRLALPSILKTTRFVPARSFVSGRPSFTDATVKNPGSDSSGPGWKGRHGEDHALNRDGYDAQSEPSQEARTDKQDETGKGGQGVTQKDERNANQRAKDDNPEAPGPVIGMNSGKSSRHTQVQETC